MTEKEDLKPCPFCGSSNVRSREREKKIFFVECVYCGSEAHLNFWDEADCWNTIDELKSQLEKALREKMAYRKMYIRHLTTQCPNVDRERPDLLILEIDKEAAKILGERKSHKEQSIDWEPSMVDEGDFIP